MRTRRRRPPLLAHLAATALLLIASVPAPAVPAGADATTDALVDAALGELDVALPDDAVTDALATLLEDAVTAGAIDAEVLDALASGDPEMFGPVIAQHLVQERERWDDVGPVWTQARAALGDGPTQCPLDEDSVCGLMLRTRIQTEAALRLAGDGDCDAECAQRLERIRERLERTIRRVEQLGPDAAGDGTDVGEMLREAERARLRLDERIRVARGEARGPGPGPAASA